MAKVSAAVKDKVLEAFDAVIEEARAEFQAEKAEAAAAWKKELARIKDEDLYLHNKEKREREDELEVELQQRKSAVSHRENLVSDRELAMDHAEDELAELKAKVAEIPVLIEEAKAAGAATATVNVKKEYEAEARIREAEVNADKRVHASQVRSLQDTVEALTSTVNSLHEELAAANARVETIASNAVNAAGQSKVTVNAANSK